MPNMPVRSGFPSSGLAILAAPPLGRIRWPTEWNQNVAARGSVELQPRRTVEDVEERSVCTECVEPQIVFGERLDDLVDVRLAHVHPIRHRPDVLDHTLDRP